MEEICLIGDEYFITGFQSAGVNKTYIVDKDNINGALSEAMRDESIGIIVMNNSDFGLLNERLRERALTQVKPTVVILSHDISAEENMRIMIKRSIGVDLWKKE